MKDKIKRIGIIAIAALIMFSFAACSDDSGGPSGPPQGGGGGGGGGGGTYMGHPVYSGTPSASTLSKYGLSESQTQAMFNAARAVNINDADYKGYQEYIDFEDGTRVEVLAYVWENKNQAKYNQVCSALSSDPNYYWMGEMGEYMSAASEYNGIPPGTLLAQVGMNMSTFVDMAFAFYFLKDYRHEDGELVRAGTLCVAYMKMSY